jgi:NAD(P)-dependent dehydrogenase (short-subunit alcohol dehydrogenase family)
MSEIKGRLTLITGSTKGIGKAIAEAFVDRQARVVVHGRDRDEAKQIGESIGAYSSVNGDLGTAAGCENVIAQLEKLGPVEILINNAGIFGVQDFFQIDDTEWLRYFQVNIMSAVRLCRELLPSMLENDWGRIINVASEAAIKPLPQMIHYSMTKTSLVSLARGMAELTKGSLVTVNSVLPGPTWTAGVEAYFEGLAADEGKSAEELIDNYFEEREPTSLIQRFIDVREVAQAVVFLATNGAVNGSAQRVEGGIVRSI